MPTLKEVSESVLAFEEKLRQGGGESGQARQRKLGRLPVRDRLAALLDQDRPFLELGLWAAHEMYDDWGGVPAGGIVTGIGYVSGQPCMIAANDATVKAGAMFPQSIKKLLRAQKVAFQLRLPIVYLVDSAGVFLPMQDEIFPDEDDFGRIFRNNSVISAAGIPQYAAVMGNCIAGGAYLPVLCDKILMTEGSQLCLAGPALVKAAVGQIVDPEELGGASMHAAISGTVDFHEPNDASCCQRIRSLMEVLPKRPMRTAGKIAPESLENGLEEFRTVRPATDLFDIVPADGRGEYRMHDVIDCLIDQDSFQEYKADYGKSLVTGLARIGGFDIGIVADQRIRSQSKKGELQIGGVLYPDSVEKAARFIMDCNQTSVPLLFLQDVQGFMVGKDAEQSGIIRSGAKLVNAVSNSVVPKFTVIVGGSYGAGNYAMCGKAYDPALMLAWPNAKNAVMGGNQAANTLLALKIRDAEKAGKPLSDDEIAVERKRIADQYDHQSDIRYGAARGWVDAIIEPCKTREWIYHALRISPIADPKQFRTGVLQV